MRHPSKFLTTNSDSERFIYHIGRKFVKLSVIDTEIIGMLTCLQFLARAIRDVVSEGVIFIKFYLKLCSRFGYFKFDLQLKWHHSSPRKLLKGQKQGGVVSGKIKNRVIDLPESQKLEVLCVQKLVPGSIG